MSTFDKQITVTVDPYDVVDDMSWEERALFFVYYLDDMSKATMENMVIHLDAETIDKLLEVLQARKDVIK